MKQVSVIIPTLERRDSLLRLLRSLRKETTDLLEIIIVEQGMNNGKSYKHFSRTYNIPLRYFFLKSRSTSAAKSFGARQAQGKILLFLDDDVVVGKHAVANHLRNFENPHVAAVSGRVITKEQTVEPRRRDVGRVSVLGNFSDGYSSLIRQDIDTVLGCNASWRKSVFEQLGGFDEKFTGNAMREESDLSLRARRQGHRIVFEPYALVHHMREPLGGARKGTGEARMYWYFHFFSNEVYFFLKHRPKLLLPFMLVSRYQWMGRCMFGFGREVSIRSLITPFAGIIDGIRKFSLAYV